MQGLETGLDGDILNLRLEEIAHGMGFLQFMDNGGGKIAHEDLVIHIHPIFIWVKNRLGQAGDLGLIIRHPLDADCGALGQNRRAVPEVEDEDAAGIQVLPGRFECRRHIFVGCLVADDVKQGDHRVETFVQTNLTNVSRGEGQPAGKRECLFQNPVREWMDRVTG